MTEKNPGRTRRFMRRQSPAVIVATIAVVLGGAGTAAAVHAITSKDIKNGTIRLADISASAQASLKGNAGPAGARGPQGAPGAPGASATALWASVSGNGTLNRHSHAVSSVKLGAPHGPGAYEVVFDRNVSGCVYSATLGGDAPASIPAGEVAATPQTDKPNAVFVGTFSGTGADADRPFMLAVLC